MIFDDTFFFFFNLVKPDLFPQVAKNGGTVTVAHFARVLNFLGIVIAASEFNLLVKRFVKDSYTVNYVAFVKAIEDAQNYMDQHGMLGLGGVSFYYSICGSLVFEQPRSNI